MVMNGLAIILTVFIMAPVAMETMELLERQRLSPSPTPQELLGVAREISPPLRHFLEKNTDPAVLKAFMGTAQRIWPASRRQTIARDNMLILVPAFTITELTGPSDRLPALFAFRGHRPYHFQYSAGHGHDDGVSHDHLSAVQAAAFCHAGRLVENQPGAAAQLSVAPGRRFYGNQGDGTGRH